VGTCTRFLVLIMPMFQGPWVQYLLEVLFQEKTIPESNIYGRWGSISMPIGKLKTLSINFYSNLGA
jgi:hypothetical protein